MARVDYNIWIINVYSEVEAPGKWTSDALNFKGLYQYLTQGHLSLQEDDMGGNLFDVDNNIHVIDASMYIFHNLCLYIIYNQNMNIQISSLKEIFIYICQNNNSLPVT